MYSLFVCRGVSDLAEALILTYTAVGNLASCVLQEGSSCVRAHSACGRPQLFVSPTPHTHTVLPAGTHTQRHKHTHIHTQTHTILTITLSHFPEKYGRFHSFRAASG